jgi:hypothetical protein
MNQANSSTKRSGFITTTNLLHLLRKRQPLHNGLVLPLVVVVDVDISNHNCGKDLLSDIIYARWLVHFLID